MPEKINLHDLELHDLMSIKTDKFGLRIVRVPGGWIYYRVSDKDFPGVFVPYNKEFRDTEDKFFVK